jgi:hypothetical protein
MLQFLAQIMELLSLFPNRIAAQQSIKRPRKRRGAQESAMPESSPTFPQLGAGMANRVMRRWQLVNNSPIKS